MVGRSRSPTFIAVADDAQGKLSYIPQLPFGCRVRQKLRHRLTASSPRSRTTAFNGTVVLRYLPSWVRGWRWIPSESEPVSRSGSATSMWNALQSKVSWPLSAQAYPLTTRRHCTCHNRKHRHRYSSGTPASAFVRLSLSVRLRRVRRFF